MPPEKKGKQLFFAEIKKSLNLQISTFFQTMLIFSDLTTPDLTAKPDLQVLFFGPVETFHLI